MKKQHIYNSKNIFALLFAFVIIFGLLHYLATTLHQTRKINAEVDAIKAENKKLYEEITQKERKLLYLKTPQRIDKDAKTQIGKKQPNEQSLTFIFPEDDTDYSTKKIDSPEYGLPILSIQETNSNYLQDWYDLFFNKKVSLTSGLKSEESTR